MSRNENPESVKGELSIEPYLEKREEVRPVLWMDLEVLVDHLQGAFEDRVEYFGYMRGDVAPQFVYNTSHYR